MVMLDKKLIMDIEEVVMLDKKYDMIGSPLIYIYHGDGRGGHAS